VWSQLILSIHVLPARRCGDPRRRPLLPLDKVPDPGPPCPSSPSPSPVAAPATITYAASTTVSWAPGSKMETLGRRGCSRTSARVIFPTTSSMKDSVSSPSAPVWSLLHSLCIWSYICWSGMFCAWFVQARCRPVCV
jgi:hypothetical protein